MDDLEAFIADIEQTAPPEENTKIPTCNECNVPLEETDGIYICPSCHGQATNILQLEETELHCDETGRQITGQVVRIEPSRGKYEVDYGWAWSTDDAIAQILSVQLDRLEKANVVPQLFRQGCSNMWMKFWVENIAPFIKDEYNDNDLIPVDAKRVMRMRDIEVLVKVKDKVMIPKRQPRKVNPRRTYSMLANKFYRKPPEELNLDDVELEQQCDSDDSSHELEISRPPLSTDNNSDVPLDPSQSVTKGPYTRNFSIDTIAILTLNRAVAFLEATARCLDLPDPIFASDIVRFCCQRIIPFFDAHKNLPEEARLSSKDKLMFQKTRPPTPKQLTRSASLLIRKIYQDRLPMVLPVPNFRKIIERFVTDMNLPYDLIRYIEDELNFTSFDMTQPVEFRPNGNKKLMTLLPQYNEWAICIMICQLKKMFNLDEKHLYDQSKLANSKTNSDVMYFDMLEWCKQMSVRLNLILTYDPYVLMHPLAKMDLVQTTQQTYKYIETLIADRVTTTTRTRHQVIQLDESYRKELTDFVCNELPKPDFISNEDFQDNELEKPNDLMHPIRDAFNRTRRYWYPQLKDESEILDIILKDFTCHKIILPRRVRRWSLVDRNSDYCLKPDMNPDWPYCFTLLLHVGAFLCFCRPKDLLHHIRIVEERLYPQAKVNRRRYYLAKKSRR